MAFKSTITMENQKQPFSRNLCFEHISEFICDQFELVSHIVKMRGNAADNKDYTKFESIDAVINSDLSVTLGSLNNSFVKSLAHINNTLLLGLVQLGKCKTSQDLAIMRLTLSGDNFVFMAVNDQNKDTKQFKHRFMNKLVESNIAIDFLNEINMSIPHKKRDKNWLIRRFMKEFIVDVKANTDLSSLLRDFKEGKSHPKILLGISHHSILSNVYNAINGPSGIGIKMSMIQDESDSTGAHDNKDPERNNCKRADACRKLYPLMVALARFTATPFAHSTMDDFPVKCCNVFEIPINPDYIGSGHDKFKTHALDHDMCISKPAFTDSQVEQMDDICAYIGNIHPHPIVTWNICRTKAGHSFILSEIRKRDKDSIIITVNNGENVVSYPEEYEWYAPKTEAEIERRKGLTLQKNLGYLKNIYDNENLPIHIIGSNMIARGQSMRSEVPNYESYEDIIYSEVLVYGVPKTTNGADVIQGVNRIAGIFKKQDDNFKDLHVFTTQKIIDDMNQFTKWYKESLQEVKKPENAELNFNQVVVKFNDKPARKAACKQPQYYKGSDGYFVNTASRKVYEERRLEKNNNRAVIGDGDIDFVKLEKSFKRWSKPYCSSKVSMLLKNLQPERAYTRNGFRELGLSVGFGKKTSVFDVMNKSIAKSGYGKILIETNNTVQLRAEVLPLYNKYFTHTNNNN